MKSSIRRKIHSVFQLRDIRLFAALLGVVSLLIAVSAQNPVNNDGIKYLQAAEAFANSGLKAAMEVYRWPFYSILIALAAKLSGLSFEHAAYLLNAALLVIIVGSFVTLAKDLGGSSTTQLFAAILILGHPQLHVYQNYIIRGFGYWGFSLLSLLFLIRYYRALKWRHALGWGIFMSVATLFRPEGAILCCFTPLVLLLQKNSGLWKRFIQTLKPYTVNIILLLFFLTWRFSSPDQSNVRIGRLNEILNQFQSGITLLTNNLEEKAALVSQAIFNDPSSNWGLTVTISGLFGICIYRLVTTLGPLHTLLSGHAIFKKLIPKEDGARKVLAYFTILNLLIPTIHIGQKFRISHRFFMLATLSLLLWSPFSLDRIFQRWREKRKLLTANSLICSLLSLALIILFVCAFIPAKPNKAYVISAGKWLRHNIPPKARLYSNSEQVSYYAQREFLPWDISDNASIPDWKSDDFIALRVKKKNANKFTQWLSQSPLRSFKVFENQQGDRVIILKPAEGINYLHPRRD